MQQPTRRRERLRARRTRGRNRKRRPVHAERGGSERRGGADFHLPIVEVGRQRAGSCVIDERGFGRLDARRAGAEHDADALRAVALARGFERRRDLRERREQQPVVAAVVAREVGARREIERREHAADERVADAGMHIAHAGRARGGERRHDLVDVAAERVDHA
ncbi:hypothetical protein OKW27_005010 [Paraburkholderia sp. 35.1]